MSGVLTQLERFFGATYPDASTAAAVAVLAARPAVPASPAGLEKALAAVVPQMNAAERAGWVAALAGPLNRFGITTPRRIAAFLGQCAVESNGFLGLEENLSYSPARLCAVWPRHFPTVTMAEACAFRPEKLANLVYANRMGNGDPQSGDGWQFRGRGLIQLSGRANYQRFAAAFGLDLDAAVEYVATQEGAADSAAWFWAANGLNDLATSWQIDLITRKINGGDASAIERRLLCQAALQAIGG